MEKGLHKPTQNERIYEWLEKNKTITSKEAMEHLGIYRLASRISDMEKNGVRFSKKQIKTENRFGELTRFTEYSLAGEEVKA